MTASPSIPNVEPGLASSEKKSEEASSFVIMNKKELPSTAIGFGPEGGILASDQRIEG